jgi:outer membrane protein, heavy metal efflux system
MSLFPVSRTKIMNKEKHFYFYWIWLIPASFFLFTGCHDPKIPGVMDDPGWSYSPESVAPIQINSEIENTSTDTDSLDAVTMHRLVLSRHPAVLASEAAQMEAVARNKVARRLPNPEIETRLMYLDGQRTKFEGGLMFSLPLGGRLGAAGQVSDGEVALADASVRDAHKQAILELGSTLVRLEGARNRLALYENLAVRSADYAQLARTRLSATISDPLDVSLVLTDAASDQRALTRSREEVTRTDAELRLLIGVTDRHQGIITPQLDISPFCHDPDSLIALAQRNSEPLLRARLEYQQSEWQAALASRQRIPDLQLGPAFDMGPDDTELGVAFSIPLPIFDSGEAEYKASLAHREAAWAAMEYASREVNSQIYQALNRLNALDTALDDLLGEVATSAAEAFDLAEGRYLAGQTDVLRLLTAHRTYASVQLEIIDITVARHETLLELESLVGRPLHSEHLPRQLEATP